ncbi:MAG: hypothetical protein PUC30_12735 [Lachnospiraceae bacterium]|nr:hypothetical protein [Lachnospiraceae bacterium]
MVSEPLKHYADPNDYNRIFYHQRNDDMEAIVQTLLTDSDCLLELCKTDFEEEIILVTDGGYDGQDNVALAKEKNVKLVTTALIGKEAPDALVDFEFNEDGTRLLKYATGHEPISQSYTKTTRQCRVLFDRNHCVGCPYQNQCCPKIYKKVAMFINSKNETLWVPKGFRELCPESGISVDMSQKHTSDSKLMKPLMVYIL